MAEIRTTLKVEITDAMGEKLVVERQIQTFTADHPPHWGHVVKTEIDAASGFVQGLVREAYGSPPPPRRPTIVNGVD